MSKKKNGVLFIVIILVTNIATFGVSNFAGIKMNTKVSIPKAEYEELTSVYEDYSKIIGVEKFIKENYLKDVDDEQLIDGQLRGLVQSLEDPYSVYMTEEEFASVMEETSGSFGGIGVVVTPGEDNLITVVSPIKGTPGEKAGIKSGDKIVKVDGTEFLGENMDKAVKLMRGEPGTKVLITLIREDKEGIKNDMDIEITREEIRVETVESEVLDDNIGYIKLTSFDELTYKDFKRELNQLESQNIEGLVIDLRNNPGGLLNVTAQIADELLGKVDIVYTQTKDGKREYLRSDKSMVDYPLALLVNGGSASASEILAGAVKDNNRGTIIGTTTFGKGVVQRLKDLPDGSGIKLTISEYFTPNGINIHGVGIEPDIVLELPEDIEEIGVENIEEDNQLKKAIEVVKSKIQ